MFERCQDKILISSIKTFGIFFVTFVWSGSFILLSWFATHPLQWLSLAGLGLVTVACLAFWVQSVRENQLVVQKVKFLNASLAALGSYVEIAIFDENQKTVFTTHPHIYPHRHEFLRKIFLKVKPSPEASAFAQWVEERQSGETLLSGGENGLGQQQRWWVANVTPIDSLLVAGRQYTLVTMIEATLYFENFNQLKNNYSNLENFLDRAPFGLFYASQTKHFIGANTTLTQWLGIERDQILGRSMDQFIEMPEDGKNVGFVTIRPPKKPEFKALLFTPSSSGPKNQASIICRLSPEQKDGKQWLNDSSLNEMTFSEAPIPAAMVDVYGVISCFNPAFSSMISEAVLMNTRTLCVGDSLYDLVQPGVRSEVATKVRRTLEASALPVPFEIHFEGGKIHTTVYMSCLHQPFGEQENTQLMMQFIDISEQKRLEQQFIQSQKMQAVGQLAGGIAHDFNNLLTAIIGFCDLLLQRYMPSDPSYIDVIQIKQNSTRAANLVRQLLAFSRQQNLQPKIINITDYIAELSALLRRLIGAGIDLQMDHGRDLWPVKVDVSQLEQVIINLAVNARDAMHSGGALIIRTGNYECKRQQRIGHELMPAGDYVLIEVTDTGHGISAENLERIFEPFFSTKEVGSGTGLGLSTVYGIVQQTGGFVVVESVIDKGSTFKIFLPRYQGEEQLYVNQAELPSGDLTGGGTILLVEDESAVRLFSSRALREKGYTVLEAESGEEALEIIRSGEKFDLLVTDVVMPKMDGPTLSKHVRDLLPDTKTIFISGYTEDTFRKNLGHDAQIHFLPKPFTLKDLASKVKEVLNVT